MEVETVPMPKEDGNEQKHLWCSCEWEEGSYFVPRGQDKQYPHHGCWRCNSCGLLVKTS